MFHLVVKAKLGRNITNLVWSYV